jgi:hypothetical protein
MALWRHITQPRPGYTLRRQATTLTRPSTQRCGLVGGGVSDKLAHAHAHVKLLLGAATCAVGHSQAKLVARGVDGRHVLELKVPATVSVDAHTHARHSHRC